MIGAETGRNGHHFFQTQPEQRGAGQQNESERDLRDDEAVTQPLRSAVDRTGARFGLKCVREMTAQVEPRDRQRDHESENNGTDESDDGEPTIKDDVRAKRQTIRAEQLEQLRSP